MSLAIASEYWTAVAAECHRQAATRILVVEKLVGRSSDREEAVPSLVEHFRTLRLEGVRIAFVEHETRDLALAELAGLLVRELGWTVQVFADEPSAQLWLRHGVASGT